jgi:predicted HD phosphohydrolase
MTELTDVFALYERWGSERYDEEVAQLDHALQTASHATDAGVSRELIAAALLHDVGHLLAIAGDVRGPHEDTGPAFLSSLFPTSVLNPITLHVPAKRYLCATEPDYHAGLSTGSMRSLERQGGPMTPDEVAAFERTPGWADGVALRRWDDAGKVDGAEVADLQSYEPLLRALACSAS